MPGGEKLTIPAFAARVKEKYPEYKDVEDTLLTQKIVEKYPEYKDKVDYEVKPSKPLPSFQEQTGIPISPVGTYKPSVKEAAQKDKEENDSYLGAMWNKVVESGERLGGGLARAAFNLNTRGQMGVLGQARHQIAEQADQKQLAAGLPRIETGLAQQAKDVVSKARTSSSSRENEQNISEGFDLTNGSFKKNIKALPIMAAGMLADIGAAAGSGGASFALQGYEDGLNEVDKLPEAKNMSEGTRQTFGVASGVINGVLEKVGLDKMLHNSGATKYITAKVTKEVTEELAKKGVKATAEEFEKLIADRAGSMANKMINAAAHGGKAGAIEGLTNVGQEALMDATKLAVNAVEKHQLFDEEEIKNTAAKRYLNSVASGAILGGVGGSIAGLRNVHEHVSQQIDQAKTEEEVHSAVSDLVDNIKDGTVHEEDAAELAPIIEQQAADKIEQIKGNPEEISQPVELDPNDTSATAAPEEANLPAVILPEKNTEPNIVELNKDGAITEAASDPVPTDEGQPKGQEDQGELPEVIIGDRPAEPDVAPPVLKDISNEVTAESNPADQPSEQPTAQEVGANEITPENTQAAGGGERPPAGKAEVTGEPANDEEWSAIRKHKLEEIDKVKTVFEKETGRQWSDIQQQALEQVQREHPTKSLYEATKAKTEEIAAKYDKKVDYNPTTKDLAVIQEFKRQTEKKINQSRDYLNSKDDVVRNAALLEVESLSNDLVNAAKALHTREAGTAFGFRQSESRMDADFGLQIRRMKIMKAQGGEPLTPEQETWSKDLWEKEKAIMEREQAHREKSMQEAFDKELEKTKSDFEQKLKSQPKTEASVKIKEKTLSQKGKDIADKIRKLKTDKGSLHMDFTLGGWDLAVEGVAKLVEGGATVAEALKKLIDDKEIGFKTEDDKAEFENALVKALRGGIDKDEYLGRIKELSDENGDTNLTSDMVAKGLVRDFVNSHIGEVDQKDILDEAAKNLRQILPDVTKKTLIEAYLKEGEFKQPTKEALNKELSNAKKQLVSIAKLEEDIQDLEGLKEIRQRSFPTERERSAYEKKLQAEKAAKIKEVTDRNNSIKEESRKLEAERNRQLSKVKDLTERKKQLEQGIIAKREAIEKSTDTPEIEKLKSEVASLTKGIRESEAKIKAGERKIETDRNRQIKIDNKRIESEVNRQLSKVNLLKAKQAKLEKGIIEKQAKNKSVVDTPEIEALKKRNKELIESINKAEADKRAAERKITSDRDKGIKSDNSKLATEINRQMKRVSELTDKKTKLEQGIREKKAAVPKKQDTPEIENLKKEVKKADDDLRKAEAEKSRLDKEAQAKKDKMAELDANIARAKKDMDLITTHKNKPAHVIDEELAAKRRELKRAVDDNSSDARVQAKKLEDAKKNAKNKIRAVTQRIADGVSPVKEKTELKKVDFELIKLRRELADLQVIENKKLREIDEKSKSKLERAADFARGLYIVSLIGSPKTLAKVGWMSVARPFSEHLTKITMGKVFDNVFPGISKAAKLGGESTSFRAMKAGFDGWFKQMGQAKMEAVFKKSEAELNKASEAYDDYIKQPGAKPSEIKRLKNELDNKTLAHLGKVVYQFIGGSSIKDALGALINRSNQIEGKFGGIEQESFKDGNWLDSASYVLNFIGRSHSALKTFSGRYSFASSFMARLEGEVAAGRDITTDKLIEIGHESYLDFERGKYQQSNFISDWFNQISKAAVNKLEKYPQVYSKAAGAFLKAEVAITRVPVNVLREAVVEYGFGTFKALSMAAKEVGLAKKQAELEGLTKGPDFKKRVSQMVEGMDETQAATIARCFRKGGIGLGLYAFAAVSGLIHFGVFPHLGQKKKKEDDLLKPGELNPGQVEVNGSKLGELSSGIIEHTPALWPMFAGLGMAQIYHDDIGKGKHVPAAAWDALYTHLKVLESNIPQSKIISPLTVVSDIGRTSKKRMTEAGLLDDPTKGEKIDGPIGDYIEKSGLKVPPADQERLKVTKDNRPMTDEEFAKFVPERKRILAEELNGLKTKGRWINGELLKLGDSKMTAQQEQDAVSKAAAQATKKAKEAVFGKQEKTMEQKMIDREDYINNKLLNME